MVIKKYMYFLCFSLSMAQGLQAGVVLLSIPKCGTNLVIKLLNLLGYDRIPTLPKSHLRLDLDRIQSLKDGCFFCAHAAADDANRNVLLNSNHKALFIYRDPRDQIISFINYMKRQNKGQWKDEILPFNDLVFKLIQDYSVIFHTKKPTPWNDPQLENIGSVSDFYELYLPWLDVSQLYAVSFERLIGVKGGGSAEAQMYEIKKICDYLGIIKTDDEICKIADQLFGIKSTFYRGLIGAWKKYFSLEHKDCFKENAGDLLVRLGYEKDFNW